MAERAGVETVAGYVRFLEVMRSTTARFSRVVDTSMTLAGASARSDRLIDAMDADLLVLGRQPPDPTPAADPGAPPTTYGLGVAYAMEGSALGAAVIARNVHVAAHPAMSYLTMVQADRPDRWPALLRALGDIREPADFSELVSGAAAVFEHVQDLLVCLEVHPR